MVLTRVFEIFFSKIIDQKLDGNNYLQWKCVIDIYVVSPRKSNLLMDPPALTTDAWTQDDIVLLHQILTSMELKIQDLVL